MSKALKEISAAESELQQQKDATFHHISSTFNAFVKILEQERKHITESIENCFQEQAELNSSKKSEVSNVLAKLDNIIKSTKKSSTDDSKTTFLRGVSKMRENIKEVKSLARSLSMQPEVLPEVEIEFMSPADFKENFNTNTLLRHTTSSWEEWIVGDNFNHIQN